MHNPMADHPIFVVIDQLEKALRFLDHLNKAVRSQLKSIRGPALRLTAVLVAALFLPLLTQGAAAQSQSETRMTLSFTIPLGGNASSSETQPRVELELNSRRYDHEEKSLLLHRNANGHIDATRFRTTIGLTFRQGSQLLLNGNRVATFGPQLGANEEENESGGGISTGAVVGIGVAALLIGGTILAADETRDSLRDSINPD